MTEHEILGRPDGSLSGDDEAAIALIERRIEQVRPDTIPTFGPTRPTLHPDHIAVHHWVTEAWSRQGRPARLLTALRAVATQAATLLASIDLPAFAAVIDDETFVEAAPVPALMR